MVKVLMLMELTTVQQESLKEISPHIQFIPTQDTIDFIEKVSSIFPQLVVIDVDLIKGQLHKILNILQAINANAKIILALSPDNLDYCHQIPRLGGINFLIKPFSSENVIQLTQSLLKIQKEGSL